MPIAHIWWINDITILSLHNIYFSIILIYYPRNRSIRGHSYTAQNTSLLSNKRICGKRESGMEKKAPKASLYTWILNVRGEKNMREIFISKHFHIKHKNALRIYIFFVKFFFLFLYICRFLSRVRILLFCKYKNNSAYISCISKLFAIWYFDVVLTEEKNTKKKQRKRRKVLGWSGKRWIKGMKTQHRKIQKTRIHFLSTIYTYIKWTEWNTNNKCKQCQNNKNKMK